MKVQKDKQVLEVTEKAYRVVYAPLGYKPVKEGARNGQRGSKTKATAQDE